VYNCQHEHADKDKDKRADEKIAGLDCEVGSDVARWHDWFFPGLGLESTFAGSAVNVQFMVKDSKKYAASGGWGFADFTKGKSGDEALHEKCFPCHAPAKDRDYVFTRYAPTPGTE
jgi:Cytochrome P460